MLLFTGLLMVYRYEDGRVVEIQIQGAPKYEYLGYTLMDYLT